MKKIIITSVILFISFANIVCANTSIVFVDMEKIITSSIAGASILKQLTKLNKENLTKFKNQETKLKDKEKKLSAQKNILSANEFQNSLEKLKLEIKKYNTNRNEITNTFKKIQFDAKNKLLQSINPILVDYSNKNSVDMILQKKNIIVGKNELDITNNIIDEVNKIVEEFKIK
tara:strand:- start:1027 stop:1548 length:522 start_codon:yes stop_codon:yes gene_type:complete